MSELLEQHNNWKAARARLEGAEPVRHVAVPPPHAGVVIAPVVQPKKRPKAVILFYDLVVEAADKHGVLPQEIMRGDRRRHVVAGRDEVAWRLFHERRKTVTAIGRLLDRDHGGVARAIKRHALRVGLADG